MTQYSGLLLGASDMLPLSASARHVPKFQVISINSTGCTNGLGTVSHSYLLLVETLPKSKSLEASHRPTLEAELSKNSSSGLLW